MPKYADSFSGLSFKARREWHQGRIKVLRWGATAVGQTRPRRARAIPEFSRRVRGIFSA